MRVLISRLLGLFRRRQLESALDEEVRAHLDLLAADFEARGMPPAAARLAARRAFGGVPSMKEAYRDLHAMVGLADLGRDVRHALRGLRRSPLFAASAVLTLAFGMSGMTAMLTITNTFMFRPLPVVRPGELVSISTSDTHSRLPHGLSFADLQDYRARIDVLVDAIGYMPRVAALNAGSGADRLTIELVTDNYFSMLGVAPAAGRLIRPGEGRARGEAPVIVLSHAYWQSRLGGDQSVIGRPVRLNGRPFTIIGVADREFRGTEALFRVDAYVPLWMWDELTEATTSSVLTNRTAHALFVIGRLKPGVTIDRARAALQNSAASLARDHPSTNAGVSLVVVPETHARPNPSIGPLFRLGAAAMTGLAVILLLIMSANAANLLMTRAAGRGREVAVRSALGAGRVRIVRQFLTESIVLAMLGGAVAVPAVAFTMRAIREFMGRAITMISVDPDLTVDARVLFTVLALILATGITAGVAPAFWACRSNFSASLKSSGRGLSAGAPGTFQSALVIAQVALSLALLVSGGLFVRSLDRARRVDLGFEPGGLSMATVAPGLQGYDASRRLAFFHAVRDRLAARPDVDDSAWISNPPLGLVGNFVQAAPDERPADPRWQAPTTYAAIVSPEYLQAARVPLTQGRSFTSQDDRLHTRVAIINSTLAEAFWPGRSALGRRLTVDDVETEVVGIVRTGKYMNVWEAPRGMIFVPLAQDVPRVATILVRPAPTTNDGLEQIRQAVREVDPDVAIYDVKTMAQHLDTGSAFLPFRLGVMFTTVFGTIGMLLAAIGLYGVVAGHVSRRTHEIGVRMALGARAADVLRGVVTQGARMAAAGVAVGTVLAFILAKLLQTLLVGTSPFDPVTYVAVIGILVTVCLLASIIPAWRAAAVNPTIALEGE